MVSPAVIIYIAEKKLLWQIIPLTPPPPPIMLNLKIVLRFVFRRLSAFRRPRSCFNSWCWRCDKSPTQPDYVLNIVHSYEIKNPKKYLKKKDLSTNQHFDKNFSASLSLWRLQAGRLWLRQPGAGWLQLRCGGSGPVDSVPASMLLWQLRAGRLWPPQPRAGRLWPGLLQVQLLWAGLLWPQKLRRPGAASKMLKNSIKIIHGI
jgi:hypothetical protein